MTEQYPPTVSNMAWLNGQLASLRESIAEANRRALAAANGGAGRYQLGVPFPWMADTDPTYGLEMNGQTVTNGALTYTAIAALLPSLVSGDDLVLPDWGTRGLAGYKAGDPIFGTLGALVGSETHTHDLGDDSYAQIGLGTPGGTARVYRKEAVIAGNDAGAYVNASSYSTGTSGTMSGATALGGSTDEASSIPPMAVIRWFLCVATSSGAFDVEAQNAMLARTTVLEDAVELLETRMQGVIPSSVVVGSGSASVGDDGTVSVDGTSSVSLNDIFNTLGCGQYQIFIRLRTTAGGTIVTRLRTDGVTESGAVYVVTANYTTLSGGPSRLASTGVNDFGYLVPTGAGTGSIVTATMMITDAASAVDTTFISMHAVAAANGGRYNWVEGSNGPVDEHDGISFITTASGGMTGTIKVVKI